jgi:hypothetical protein
LRFDVSQSIRRAYGPAREEDECGMVMDAGLDDAGRDTGEWGAPGRDSNDGFSDTGPRDRAAPDMPDPRKLAQDWITLWQSELSAMAADPEIRESWQTVMALWAGAMSTMLRGLPREPAAYGHDGTRGRAGPAEAPRPAPAAASPDARDAEIDRLARNVADLERRMGELARLVEREPRGDPAIHPKSGSGRTARR